MAELADSIVEDEVKLEEPNIEDVITETADELEQLFADSYLTTEELFNSDPLAKQAANFAIARGVSPSAGWLWKLGGVEHPVEEVKLESGYTWIIGDYDTFDDDIFLSPEGLEYTFDELTTIAQGDDTLSEDIAGLTGEGTTEEQQTANIVAGFQYLFPDEDPYSQLEYYFGSEDEDVLNERVEEFFDVMEQAGRTKETESLVKSLWSDITDAQMAYIFGEDYLQIAIGESDKAFQDKLSSIASSYNLPQGAIDSYINALKEYEDAKTFGYSALGSAKQIDAKKELENVFGKDYENSELYKELSSAFNEYWDNYGKFEEYSDFGRSLVAGIGDIISGVGGVAGWVGLDSVSEYFNEEAERLQNVAPLVEDVEWTWDNAFTGNFWRSVGLNVARTIPFSVALLPLGLVGFGVGVGIATLLRIASPILRGVFGVAIGGSISGLAESTLEAGNVYNEAIAQGMTEEESSQAAATAFRNNAALLSLTNAAELFIGLKVANPTKTLNSVIKRGWVTVSKAGRVALTEAGQEVFQEVIQKNALGQEIDWTSDDMKMVALVGGIMGVGMGTALDMVSGIVNKTVNNLPEQQKAQFEEIKASLPEDMPEAEKNVKALEEIADDKTVQRILETVSALSKIDAYQEMVKPKNEAEQIAWDKTFDKQRQDVIDKSGIEFTEPTIAEDTPKPTDYVKYTAEDDAIIDRAEEFLEIRTESGKQLFGKSKEYYEENISEAQKKERAELESLGISFKTEPEEIGGGSYYDGMAVSVITSQPVEGITHKVILKVLSPAIYYKGELIKRAEVIVGIPAQPSQSTMANKQKQLEIINKTNPAPNDFSTWIRNIDDIKTAQEVFAGEDFGGTPDFTQEMADTALETGKIKIYSSFPIKDGVFVTPSKQEAQNYAGSGKVYERIVNINDVAWIDEIQGQLATITEPQMAKGTSVQGTGLSQEKGATKGEAGWGPGSPKWTELGDVMAMLPTGNLTAEQIDGICNIFGQLISSNDAKTRMDLTTELRKAERAKRAANYSVRIQELIIEGKDAEEAESIARKEIMSGKLPSIDNDTIKDITGDLRKALFAKVYNVLRNDPYELMSTNEALTNALNGKPIPREPGTKGGSAYSRLMRVFGDNPEVMGMLEQEKPIDDIVEGVFREYGQDPIDLDQEMLDTLRDLPDKGRQLALFAGPTKGEVSAAVEGAYQIAKQRLDAQLEAKEITQGEYDVQLAAADEKYHGVDRVNNYEPELNKEINKKSIFSKKEQIMIVRALKAIGSTTIDIGNLLRALKASFDMSFGRQMAPLILMHPRAFTRAFVKNVRAFINEANAESEWQAHKVREGFTLHEQYGGDVLRKREFEPGTAAYKKTEEFGFLDNESFLGKLTDKLFPWVNWSQRAFETGINDMVITLIEDFYHAQLRIQSKIASGEIVLKEGEVFDIHGNMKEYLSHLANASGRAEIGGKLGALAPAANAMFFSLRLNLGRLLSVKALFSGNKYVRKEAWKDFGSFVGIISSVILLGALAGLWEVETDPRSTNFMKIRIGNIRVDPWGGYQQFVVFFTRIATNTGLVSTTGMEYDVNFLSALTTFLRSKASPLASTFLELKTGKDYFGDEIDLTDAEGWVERFAPFALWDIYEAWKDEGLKGGFIGLPALVGMNIQTYSGNWEDNFPKLGTPKFPDNQAYGIDEPLYDTGDFYSDTAPQFKGVDPESLTESKGYPAYIKSVAEAKQLVDEMAEWTSEEKEDYLTKNTDKNALLAIWGKSDLYSLEAYYKAVKLADDLDIPENGIDWELPSEEAFKNWFNYLDKMSVYDKDRTSSKLSLQFPLSNVTEDNIEMFYKKMEYALLRKTDGNADTAKRKAYRRTHKDFDRYGIEQGWWLPMDSSSSSLPTGITDILK